MSIRRPIVGSAVSAPCWTCCIPGCETSVRFLLPAEDGDVRPEFRGRPVCFTHGHLAYWEDVTDEARRYTRGERRTSRRRTPGTRTPAAQREHDILVTWLETLADVGPPDVIVELADANCMKRAHAAATLRRRAATLELLLRDGESSLMHLTQDHRRSDFRWMGGKGWMLARRKPEGAYTRMHYRLTQEGRAMAERLVVGRAEEAA